MSGAARGATDAAAGAASLAGADAPAPKRVRWPSLSRAPFALQVMVLMATGVIFAQIVTTLVVIVLPPPRPPIYALHDIATALQGGSLDGRFGRFLARRIAAAPPPVLGSRRRPDGRNRYALAALLSAPPDQVRLDVMEGPRFGWLAGAGLGPLGLSPFRGPAGGFRGEGREFRSGSPSGSPPPGPPPSDARTPDLHGPTALEERTGEFGRPSPFGASQFGAERLVFGGFVAALKGADGRWTIVQSPPEPFPAEWQRRILLWLCVSLAVVLPAGYMFARRITAPLGAFANAAERFGKDLNAPPIERNGPAELAAAADAFNDMQGRLRRYVDHRTAMVGAISHDLRTPLARIRFKLERADEGLRASVNADVTQMEAMLAGVLDFIRDAGAARVRQPLDVVSLLECVVDDEALMGRDVTLDVQASPVVDGDATALKGLFENLVGNALKYGGRARVTVDALDRDVSVRVADSGPGLPDHELEQVFQPFYRTDPARNMDVGGIGLGLWVARSVARQHGGDVWLTSSPEGLTAHVQLPPGAPPSP